MQIVPKILETDIKENLECNDSMRPYIRMLSEQITSNTCLVEKDILRFPGSVFKNKKLLPYDGSSVKVLEYADYIVVFTQEGKHIVSLHKDRFRSE